jgi:hypothetical protein
MLLFCKGGVVHAFHDDEQDFDHSVYHREAGVDRIIPVPDGMSLDRVGENRHTHPQLGSMPDTRPFATPEPTKDLLLRYAAYWRWRTEVGGTMCGDIPVPTDRATMAKLAQLHQAFDAGLMKQTTLKVEDVHFMSIDQPSVMAAVYTAALQHVNAAFEAEAQCVISINAGDFTHWDDVDHVFAGVK